MKDQRSELRLNIEWWMFCIVSLSLIKSTKLLTCSALFPLLLLVKHLILFFQSYISVCFLFSCRTSDVTVSIASYYDGWHPFVNHKF